MVNNYYNHLNIDYSSHMLRDESFLVHYSPFKSGRTSGSWFDNATTWLQGRVHDTRMYTEIHRLSNFFKKVIECNIIKPRFYKQEAGSSVPMHSDMNTKCCINIILSKDSAPIVFEDIGEVTYKCALLNITKRHMVPAFHLERLLLKFSIFDKTYEEARLSLKNYLLRN